MRMKNTPTEDEDEKNTHRMRMINGLGFRVKNASKRGENDTQKECG